MKKAVRKICAKTGATYLIGMLAFLMATMVCAVVVPAALTGVKSAVSDRTFQQNQLTLNSAAQLVRELLKPADGSGGDVMDAAAEPALKYTLEQKAENIGNFSASVDTVSFAVKSTVEGTAQQTVNCTAEINFRGRDGDDKNFEEKFDVRFSFGLPDQENTVLLEETLTRTQTTETVKKEDGEPIEIITVTWLWENPDISHPQ